MTQTKALLGITVMTLAACQTGSEDADASKAADGAGLGPVSEEVLKTHVATLADDSFEGRAPGTEGGRKTIAYLSEQMAELGLEPLGEDYALPVTLVSRDLAPGSSRAVVSTPEGSDSLEYGPEAVYWTKRDEETVAIEDSELVFVGHGVVAPEFGWNDYAGIDAEGKTVVMLINDPGFRIEGDTFGGKAMTYYGRWTYKFEEAARQGADAAIIVHQTEPAAYGWNVVEGSWSGPQLDLPRSEGATRPVALEGWITLDQAEALFGAAGLDFAEMERAAMQEGFTPVDMGGLTLSAELVQTLETTRSANVAGVLPGTERPDEYVLYTAHWDHLGIDEALIEEGEDGIYNGAVDNATGTGGILAIAQTYAEADYRPARSQIFLAVTAEESGLLGSKAFASEPPVRLADIVGGINIDAMLPLGPTSDLMVIGYGSSELEDILLAEARERNVSLSPDPTPQNGYFYRSDHVEFAKRGVPMLYVDSGTDLLEGGTEAGEAAAVAYTEGPYHGPSDEFDASEWRFDGMAGTLTILRDVGLELADGERRPNWYEGNEFRAIRDEQLREAGIEQ